MTTRHAFLHALLGAAAACLAPAAMAQAPHPAKASPATVAKETSPEYT